MVGPACTGRPRRSVGGREKTDEVTDPGGEPGGTRPANTRQRKLIGANYFMLEFLHMNLNTSARGVAPWAPWKAGLRMWPAGPKPVDRLANRSRSLAVGVSLCAMLSSHRTAVTGAIFQRAINDTKLR